MSVFMRSHLWDTAAMDKFEEKERLKIDRKMLKPQVERRRRERMNRSLENLRILLAQGHEQQAASQKRLEKAEILEHTVLFLQSSSAKANKYSSAEDESDSVGHQFMDGFSVCLEKAARFLKEETKARGLPDSVPSSLYQCLSRAHWSGVRDMKQNHAMQGLQCVKRQTHTHYPYRVPLRHTHPNTVQHHQNSPKTSMSGPTSPQASGRQGVWRPWP
ncbi:hairy and enhancer of split related-7 [Clarias gariepinus]|uniref:hairy and enhancer of split related-7 n=1 Tax=Clarias gariepinus TaxID=13013 RepID=UPI00234D73FB|nr:hairy and enhancer of split related-7 [Clarias gariepinus]